jgi:Na+/H+ antiporter NhaD/arsenite permease-like protein
MFILVEGLNATGWVDRLAWWLGSGVRGSVWAALFAVGSFSVLLANLANNQVSERCRSAGMFWEALMCGSA